MQETNSLPYRHGVNGIVVDKNGEFLLVNKKGYAPNEWEFPGGGIESGESPEEGILRELSEELGSRKFKILAKSSKIHQFEWDKGAQEHEFKKRGVWYRGQQKFQYLVLFTGQRNELTANPTEIQAIRWVHRDNLGKYLLFEGQLANARDVLQELTINLKKLEAE